MSNSTTTSLDALLESWHNNGKIPDNLTRGQLQEILDVLPNDGAQRELRNAINFAIEDRPSRAA